MKKILIIDDAATVRMYHRTILEQAGFDVTEATNGIEALEHALSVQFDLFVVDINMPKMDGYAFLQEYRAHDEFAQVPAIMVSTEAEVVDKELAYKSGANGYITKPIKPEELVRYVQLLIGE